MTNNDNIHPIYFDSFVGTWKRLSAKGAITDGYIKFNEDLTFEEDGSLGYNRGTINGDVDEISVDDDGHNNNSLGTKGKAILVTNSEKGVWSYILKKGRLKSSKSNDLILEFRKNRKRAIYVGNLPLESAKVNIKKRKKEHV